MSFPEQRYLENGVQLEVQAKGSGSSVPVAISRAVRLAFKHPAVKRKSRPISTSRSQSARAGFSAMSCLPGRNRTPIIRAVPGKGQMPVILGCGDGHVFGLRRALSNVT